MYFYGNRFTNKITPARVAAHGEVFTAQREVNAMCDLVNDECNRIESRFLEPACGDGIFLAEILRRKLANVIRKYGSPRFQADYERASIVVLMSLYGVELLEDNVLRCRQRLFAIWEDAYNQIFKSKVAENCKKVARLILDTNIWCGDALTMLQGNGKPIVFAEWSFLNGCMVKRRDFIFDHCSILRQIKKKPYRLLNKSHLLLQLPICGRLD